MSNPNAEDLTIWIESGVSALTGEPFCRVSLDGRTLGQLTPAEVRAMALHWLGAAEAAESDAMVFAELRENAKVDEQAALRFVGNLRERRRYA